MKILIDNGHGENTPGKRSPDGQFREYLWCREVAIEVVRRLRALGQDAELIVKESIDVPLQERCRRVNDICKRLGKTRVILVSIHVNACGNGSRWYTATGWSAYTTKGVTKADDLARCLYDAAATHLAGQKIRRYNGSTEPDYEADFCILQHTSCPAVLTENFFQDNHADVSYITSVQGKNAIIDTHVDGIMHYVNGK